MTFEERRRALRHRITIAVRVQGFLPDGGSWTEMAETDDVSAGGASLVLKQAVELGQVLHLSLPLPKPLRQYDIGDMTYRVYALVRGITRQHGGTIVGVMFFGKFPPRGFEERPWMRFLLPSDRETMEAAKRDAARSTARPAAEPAPARPVSERPARAASEPAPSGEHAVSLPTWTSSAGVPAGHSPDAAERRAHTRYAKFMNLTLQQMDASGAVIREELTVADNLSKGGTHVLTTLGFASGDIVLLRDAGGEFATRAEVRAVHPGENGIARLHLRFLDHEPSDRLLLS